MSPKTNNTRQQRAVELMKMLERGPILFVRQPGVPFGVEDGEAEASVRIWLRSWIIPLVKQLVPELKEKNNDD